VVAFTAGLLDQAKLESGHLGAVARLVKLAGFVSRLFAGFVALD
jgi:hypothetical protein